MNPTGKTPVLQLDDGTILSESTAITEYLDNLDGNPVLTGRTPLEKGLIHMMQRRVEILLLDPVDDYFHYATVGLGPALGPWRMPDWAGKKEWAERRGRHAIANLPYFEEVLGRTTFLAGASFSMADITLFAALAFARGAGLNVPATPHIGAWEARVAAVPAVRDRSGQTFLPEDISRRHA
jgi:glutathione S-transferase